MKQTLISIILICAAVPCLAQWRYTGNLQVLAYGVHDTSLFVSYEGNLGRHNPNGEADTGINFSYGNVSSFASLGRYFFANIVNSEFQYPFRTSNDGSLWQE